MVGTNRRLRNSWPAGCLAVDLSVLRQIRCPLRNNLWQGQGSPQVLQLVTQLVRIDSFSFDDSIINYRYSLAFIPRVTVASHQFLSLTEAK